MIEELRQFIRHPSSIPLSFRLGRRLHKQTIRDVGQGGLCFNSHQAISSSETILIEINACKPSFTAEGIVRWCRPEGAHFLVGVAFRDKAVRFAMPMVEQICHIENYRCRVEAESGKVISSQQAAYQRIEHYAGEFPTQD